jgi:hypothetical protein
MTPMRVRSIVIAMSMAMSFAACLSEAPPPTAVSTLRPPAAIVSPTPAATAKPTVTIVPHQPTRVPTWTVRLLTVSNESSVSVVFWFKAPNGGDNVGLRPGERATLTAVTSLPTDLIHFEVDSPDCKAYLGYGDWTGQEAIEIHLRDGTPTEPIQVVVQVDRDPSPLPRPTNGFCSGGAIP